MPRLLVLSTCAVQGDGWRWSAIRSACLSTTRTAGDRNRWVHGLTDQVRRVEACGRQCPCTHVRVSEREVARFVTLNDVGEDATETDGARAS
jgi:hypothetical protein